VYLVRTTADKDNHVLEENENDNTSYALIRVTGENVTILERGQGTDPWDPRKVVFAGEGPAAKEMAAPQPVYVEEATAAVVPGVTHVAAAAIAREVLPRTGGEAGLPLVTLTTVTGAALVVRRRVLRARPRS
jgi:hypothetical protein